MEIGCVKQASSLWKTAIDGNIPDHVKEIVTWMVVLGFEWPVACP